MNANGATASTGALEVGWLAAAWLERLAAPKLTLLALIALAAGVLSYYVAASASVWLLVSPLLLCALNLSAAILTKPVFRHQTALLTFHLALLAVVLLVAAGRLSYLTGQLELAEGETFGGQLTQSESGPWHRSQLDRAAFSNDGYSIHYEKGVRRGPTRNAVHWLDDAGQTQRAVIGDNEPLVRRGYRFYTSANKGFAPVFVWQPNGGAAQRGSVNLPSYPAQELRQSLEWNLPSSPVMVWTMLQFDEVLLDPQQPSQLRLPSQHKLVLRIGDARHELQPGGRITLPQGILTYEHLALWMGYTVFYDWTLPWLAAASVLVVVALGWHFQQKFAARAWDA